MAGSPITCKARDGSRALKQNRLESERRTALLGKPLSRLGELRLERPVGFLGRGEIELADLAHLRREGLIGFLGIALLHFPRLVERTHLDGLLDGGRALLKAPA